MKELKTKQNAVLYFIIAAGLAMLVWIAASTNVWDDETNGYFLSRLPLTDLWALMSANAHEDPPLYDVILWAWVKLAAYDPLLLRLPSICFWAVALAGIKRAGDLLSEGRAGLICAAVAAVMPVHWMFPAALRWYSLFACLATWNFVTFLPLLKGHAVSRGMLAAYVLSGAAMWYTNYSAPAVFLAQGLVALLLVGWSKTVLKALILRWVLIGVLYLPWLPVFLRQMGHEVPPVTIKFLAASLYALWAGEASTPMTWWVSIPAGIVALTACLIIWQRRREAATAAAMTLILLLLLIVKDAIWTKRLMILSPFLAVALGTALSLTKAVGIRLLFLVAAGVMLAGSLVNVIRREGWLSYRWLMPVREVVEQTQQASPQALLLTNSNCVAFSGHNPVGLNTVARRPDLAGQLRLLPFFDGMGPEVKKTVYERLAAANEAAYIHESSGVRFTTALPWVEQTMRAAGFALEKVENHAPASDEYLRFHPAGGNNLAEEDRCRLVVARFKRTAAR